MIGLDFFLDRFGIFLSVLFVFIGLMSFIYALATIKQKGHRLEFYRILSYASFDRWLRSRSGTFI